MPLPCASALEAEENCDFIEAADTFLWQAMDNLLAASGKRRTSSSLRPLRLLLAGRSLLRGVPDGARARHGERHESM